MQNQEEERNQHGVVCLSVGSAIWKHRGSKTSLAFLSTSCRQGRIKGFLIQDQQEKDVEENVLSLDQHETDGIVRLAKSSWFRPRLLKSLLDPNLDR
jgi:hypothetical protein